MLTEARAVIVATGATARRLGLPGEERLWNNGISACAVCDGALPMFRKKPLVVIGGAHRECLDGAAPQDGTAAQAVTLRARNPRSCPSSPRACT